MKALKYPKKFKGIKTYIIIPIEVEDGTFWGAELLPNGTTKLFGYCGHHTEKSCWIPCMAYNKRVGYSNKEIKLIIKNLTHAKKSKKAKKQKSKKAKKGKKNKT